MSRRRITLGEAEERPGAWLTDEAQPDTGTEALRAALRHRRDYEARGLSHVECGAEEDIKERLLLAEGRKA